MTISSRKVVRDQRSLHQQGSVTTARRSMRAMRRSLPPPLLLWLPSRSDPVSRSTVGSSECRWQVEEPRGCAGMKMARLGQHGDKMFQEAPQFRGPRLEMLSRCLFQPWVKCSFHESGCRSPAVGGGGGRNLWLWLSGVCFGKTMADGNASILEEALCVHGHATQSSKVSRSFSHSAV